MCVCVCVCVYIYIYIYIYIYSKLATLVESNFGVVAIEKGASITVANYYIIVKGLEPHHLIVLLYSGSSLGSFTPLQRCSWCILQPQLIGLGISWVLNRMEVVEARAHLVGKSTHLGVFLVVKARTKRESLTLPYHFISYFSYAT